MKKTKFLLFLPAIIVVVIFLLYVTENSFPSKIDYNEVSKIESNLLDDYYIPLYSDKEKDKIKIRQIVSFYNNQIVPKLVKGKVHLDPVKYNFFSEVGLIFNDGQSIYISFGDAGLIYQEMPDGCYYFRDTKLQEQFTGLLYKSSKLARSIMLRPLKVHIGDRIYITADYIPGNEATIELAPRNREKLKPIIIKTIPVVEGSPIHYNFVLSEQIGKTADGSPGKVSPGEWSVYVGGKHSRWGSTATGQPITILK